MTKVVHVTDPFDDKAFIGKEIDASGKSIVDCAKDLYGKGWTDFHMPTICLVDGQAVKREHWSKKGYLRGKEDVAFVQIPGFAGIGLTSILTSIVVGAAVAAISLAFIPKPEIGETPEADPTFSLKGQRNQNRLGNPIEVGYGTFTHYPSYAARPYNEIIDNQQFLYQLFVIGQGSYVENSVKIEDTPIENFDEVETEYIQPGDPVTLFPENVATSNEVGDLILDPPAVDPGWKGPFVANPSQTETTKLSIDVALPNGLYYTGAHGNPNPITVTAEFEYQLINDVGDAIGDWTSLVSFSRTLATLTPQRFTLSNAIPLPAGRYQVRGRRTNEENSSPHKTQEELRWEGLRAFLEEDIDYGDVTMIAVKALATNNLNDSSSNRINVNVTRILPVYDKFAKTWTDQPTNSPIWAVCDVLRAEYGGKLLDEFIDLDALYDLDLGCTTRQDEFNYVFEEKVTIWEALKLILRVCRCQPIPIGSKIGAVRDELRTVPNVIYNKENIVRGSFERIISFKDPSEYDGLQITYIDPDAWKEETVDCLIGTDTGNRMENLKLRGITSRAQAYREGLYERAKKIYEREQLSLTTGLEGHIATLHDLAAVHPIKTKWAFSGNVIAKDGLKLTLSDPVTFYPNSGHEMVFVTRTGEASAPYTVCAGISEFSDEFSLEFRRVGYIETNIVYLPSEVSECIFVFNDNEELPKYNFGRTEEYGKDGLIKRIEPSDGTDEIKIIMSNYSVIPRSLDSAPVPALGTTPPAINVALPIVERIYVHPSPETEQAQFNRRAMVGWKPAEGAVTYLLQHSVDGVNWEEEYTGDKVSHESLIRPGRHWYRVAGINFGRGPWSPVWSGSIGSEFSNEFTNEYS